MFGAISIFHFLFDHLVNAIPRSWVPWPFKKIIHGKAISLNKNRYNLSAGDSSATSSGNHHRYGGGGR